MPGIFRTDRNTDQLIKDLERDMPVKFRRATASLINSMAFELRGAIIHTISKEMEVRSPGFVRRQIRVTKANPGYSVAHQYAIAGSVYADRFSGWIEQQTGKEPVKDQTYTDATRGGNSASKVPDAYRLKTGRNFARDENYASKYARTRGQRTVAMIKSAKSGKLQRPFIVQGRAPIGPTPLPGRLGNLKYGLHTIQGGKLVRIQTFGQRPDVRRVDWMGQSLRRMDNIMVVSRVWRRKMDNIRWYARR